MDRSVYMREDGLVSPEARLNVRAAVERLTFPLRTHARTHARRHAHTHTHTHIHTHTRTHARARARTERESARWIDHSIESLKCHLM